MERASAPHVHHLGAHNINGPEWCPCKSRIEACWPFADAGTYTQLPSIIANSQCPACSWQLRACRRLSLLVHSRNLTQEHCFVRGRRRNNGLRWVEARLVHAAVVPRQPILQLLRVQRIPHAHHLVSTARSHALVVARPRALKKVLLKRVLVAMQDLGAALRRRKGAHVPHAQRVVHTVCQQVRALVVQGHARDAVAVPMQLQSH